MRRAAVFQESPERTELQQHMDHTVNLRIFKSQSLVFDQVRIPSVAQRDRETAALCPNILFCLPEQKNILSVSQVLRKDSGYNKPLSQLVDKAPGCIIDEQNSWLCMYDNRSLCEPLQQMWSPQFKIILRVNRHVLLQKKKKKKKASLH